ncbi:hypothetical protein FDO65_21755 [Nakamurella flava]|uniref:ABC transporter permease n=1 Tax=Nakamurella flava TaxID=2576308 RepID=A0A4U6Q6T2_9ACTN|nr:hypothetical protein [Nakamurella flava]TKV55970.1 hypothetical protein FDO65_21755 [Nakamurella flava]
MTLVNVERIKLFSTRSPYWCLVAIAAVALLFALLIALVDNGSAAIPALALQGVNLGMYVFMVLAALTVTTEYRFGTIRSTFLAAPNRTAVLVAKTALVVVLGAVVGLLAALAAFFLTKALAKEPPAPLVLSSAADWREVAGHAALFAIAGVIAVAVGTLLRQTAGAVALLLLWPLIVESLFGLIPTVGEKVGPWLPFRSASAFVSPTESVRGFSFDPSGPSPLQGLLVFAATAVVLWVVAALVVNRRDA